MKYKVWIGVLLGVLLVLCAVVLFLEWNPMGKAGQDAEVTQSTESADSESSQTYTWEEYVNLSLEEQDAFFQEFESVEAFEAWMNAVRPKDVATIGNWDKPGKTPDAYTWKEYQSLTQEEQEAFYQWFGTAGAFEAWMAKAKPAETTEPAPKWDKPGKAPDAYTWVEYQALTPKEQEAFFQWFGSVSAFEAWMAKVNLWIPRSLSPNGISLARLPMLTPGQSIRH